MPRNEKSRWEAVSETLMRTVLGLDPDKLVACVSCGLCLPHCPTYRATEEESASPRGRIALMRAVEAGELAIDEDFVRFMERCVMCRGCETACPSAVQFGALMEQTRVTLGSQRRIGSRWMRLALKPLGHHRLLLVGSSALGVLQRLRMIPMSVQQRLGLPARIPIRRAPLGPLSDRPTDAWLYTGCVMDAWQRDVHNAALRVMAATGANVNVPDGQGACCGALHVHLGLGGDARRLALRTMAAFPGDAPIVVDSAGCGAQLKDYGHLLGTEAARVFSARVRDVGEWLAPRMNTLRISKRFGSVVAIQDPCHLRHVQRAHLPWRIVLSAVADTAELDDDGRCCGAGGSYSITQPELAGSIRDTKVEAIRRTGAPIVASANPGCSMWLSGAGLDVRHPIQIVDEVLHGS